MKRCVSLPRLLSRRPLILGTVILTATGLITRLIGFFYRIYLARLFGEEGMGIYQLLTPVLSLSFSLCAAAYQTAISKYVAEYPAGSPKRFQTLFAGLRFSLPLSVLCCAVLYGGADRIATTLLQEPRTASMLRILAFSIPFSAVHACINGYFLGLKNTLPPSISQLAEQLTRVGCVYLCTAAIIAEGKTPSINIAVLGLGAGELVSMTICLGCIGIAYKREHTRLVRSACRAINQIPDATSRSMLLPIFRMALPLTLNRLVLNLLQSVEAVSIPARLRIYGYAGSTALRIYGVLTGMALPMIFFPNALTNAVSVLLLPTISERQAAGDRDAVRSTILRTLQFCGVMGISCLSFFLLFGDWIGTTLFDSALAGHFITTLSFLCPFLYLDATLSSILQGLGRAGTIFFMNITALLLRLAFVFGAIPRFGITGYLWGMLASQIFLSILYLLCLGHILHAAGKHAG
ncbi:MAG: polysaccharide biosynthesis protein [Lachnospiraceae bacterium]|nr:polysaccharide biosynthesis protein [Lachnospiraceae bacterium]